MTINVLFAGNLKEKYRDPLETRFPEVKILASTEEEELLQHIPDADILVGWGGIISSRLLQNGKRLKWVHALTTGVEKFLHPEIVNSDIILTNSKGLHKYQLSEHVFSFILGFARNQFIFRDLQHKKNWEKLSVRTLAHSTLGIIGLGATGREIARKGKAFDMNVEAVKRNPDRLEGIGLKCVDAVYAPYQLEEFLPRVDYLVLSVPLTAETRHMMGANELSLLQEHAFLVNVSRGDIIDESALYRMLAERCIGGAGLDVFTEEPLPETSPFWELENCFITPHVAGASPDYNREAIALFRDNLEAYLRGDTLLNRVDKQKGY